MIKLLNILIITNCLGTMLVILGYKRGHSRFKRSVSFLAYLIFNTAFFTLIYALKVGISCPYTAGAVLLLFTLIGLYLTWHKGNVASLVRFL